MKLQQEKLNRKMRLKIDVYVQEIDPFCLVKRGPGTWPRAYILGFANIYSSNWLSTQAICFSLRHSQSLAVTVSLEGKTNQTHPLNNNNQEGKLEVLW